MNHLLWPLHFVLIIYLLLFIIPLWTIYFYLAIVRRAGVWYMPPLVYIITEEGPFRICLLYVHMFVASTMPIFSIFVLFDLF